MAADTPQKLSDPYKSKNRSLLAAWSTAALFIPSLSAFGRPLQHWTYQNLGGPAVPWVIGMLLIALGGSAVRWLTLQSPHRNHMIAIVAAVALALIFIGITTLLPRAEERMHFVTFGLFGFLSLRLFPASLAVLVTLIWSGGDELFQAWLPDRVGDWRDVRMNALAGAIGITLAWLGARTKPEKSAP